MYLQAFFRRSLQTKMEYQCVGNDDCVIEPGKRNACSACRLKKCIDVGMSTAGVCESLLGPLHVYQKLAS